MSAIIISVKCLSCYFKGPVLPSWKFTTLLYARKIAPITAAVEGIGKQKNIKVVITPVNNH